MTTFAVFIYAPTAAERQEQPERDAALAEHGRHAEDLAATGAVREVHPLAPSSRTVSLRAAGRTDGPYSESVEAIVGLYLLEADDVGAAVRIAGANPAVRQGGGVEVRPVLA